MNANWKSCSEMGLLMTNKLFSSFCFSKFYRIKSDFGCNVPLYTKKLYPQLDSLRKSHNVRRESIKIYRTWLQQVEFIMAYHVRRSHQMLILYKKWWSDLVANSNCQRFVLSALLKRFSCILCFAPMFSWDEKRIKSDELSWLKTEFQKAKYFSNKFAIHSDPSLTNNEDNVNCNCDRCRHLTDDGWNLFYQGNGFFIWRKEHMNYKNLGLYVYKVFGQFKDVSASDFFQVQIDTDYRKEWDSNSVELQVVDSDTLSNSDILYWEFLFPSMFYNRDYVCNRRYEIDHENKIIAIVNQSVEHPSCPPKPTTHRVKEYWSHTIIKPMKDSFDELGIEFTITYFDNPELSIPSCISIWYTVIGMPEYIMKQKQAAMYLAERRHNAEIIDCGRAVIDRELGSNESQGQNKKQGQRVLLI